MSSTGCLTSNDIQQLDFSSIQTFSRLRGIPGLSQDGHIQLLRHDCLAAIKSGGACIAILSQNRVIAVAHTTRLAWDSQHFQLPMANLMVATATQCTHAMCHHLVEELLQYTLTTLGIPHISSEIDADDILCLDTVTSLGFETLDTKHIFRGYDVSKAPAVKFQDCVRPYRAKDKAAVMKLVRQTTFDSRFTRDPRLSAHKANSLYQSWFSQLLDESSPSIRLVFQRGGEIQACGATEPTDLADFGIPLVFADKGLYAASPRGVGGYYPMMLNLIRSSLAKYPFGQTVISDHNKPAKRVLQRLQQDIVNDHYLRYSLRYYNTGFDINTLAAAQ